MSTVSGEPRRTYVLAGTHQQAVDAMRGVPSKEWRYCSEPHHLFGVHGGNLRIVGTFWERRDAHDLYDRARASGLEETR